MDNYIKNDATALRVQAMLCDKQEMSEVTAEVSLPLKSIFIYDAGIVK